MDVYSQAEVFIELNMNIYYRGYETMKKKATKIQDKDGRNPCHVSVTMVNNVCDYGKRIEHLLLESFDNPIEIEIE